MPRANDWIHNNLIFNDIQPNGIITITFPVRETEARYTVNANAPGEQTYTCTFRTSTLVGISPRDDSPTSYPLYERNHLREPIAPPKSRPTNSFPPVRSQVGNRGAAESSYMAPFIRLRD